MEQAILVVVFLLLGIVIGITSFARILSWLLKTALHSLSALVGLMIGALRSVWPFMNTETRMPTLPQKLGQHRVPKFGSHDPWHDLGSDLIICRSTSRKTCKTRCDSLLTKDKDQLFGLAWALSLAFKT